MSKKRMESKEWRRGHPLHEMELATGIATIYRKFADSRHLAVKRITLGVFLCFICFDWILFPRVPFLSLFSLDFIILSSGFRPFLVHYFKIAETKERESYLSVVVFLYHLFPPIFFLTLFIWNLYLNFTKNVIINLVYLLSSLLCPASNGATNNNNISN